MHLRFVVVFAILAVVFLSVAISGGSAWRNALEAIKTVEKVKSHDFVVAHVHWGLYWGFLFNGVVCALLAATAPWWGGSRSSDTEPSQSPAGPLSGRGWLWLLLILAAAGALRWARLDLSLYNDEAHNFRRYFAGYFQTRSDGTLRWREPTWAETLWLNKVGNNSTPFSAMARLGYGFASKVTGAPQGSVLEWGLRLPAWIAGMSSLVLLWLLMRRLLPGTHACWWILLLAALHPWHVRYSSEARGYGFLVLGISACLYCAVRAWQEDRWRWWLLLGVAQFFSIWSFSGSLYYFVTFNGLLLVGWMVTGWKTPAPWARLARPIVGLLVGAMLTVPLMLPMLPQLLGALQNNFSIQGQMGSRWWADVAGNFIAGIRWQDGDPANPLNLSIARILQHFPALWLALAAFVILMAVGVFNLCKNRGIGPILLLAGPTAILLGWFAMGKAGNFIHLWYLIHALPGCLIVLAAASRLRLVLLAPLVIVLSYWLVIDLNLATRTKENLRGVVESVPAGALHIAAYSDADIYDRKIHILEEPGNFDTLIAKARAEKALLYFSFSRKIPDPAFEAIFHRVETSGEFQKVSSIWGLEEGQFSHFLYKLQ